MAFTLRNKIRSKSYIWSTAIMAVLLIVVANLPYILERINRGSDEPTPVGYIQGAYPDIVQGMEAFFAQQEKPDVRLVPVPAGGSPEAGEAALREALDAGKIKGYITFTDQPETGFPRATYQSKAMFDHETGEALRLALENVKTEMVFRRVQLSEADRMLLSTPVSIDVRQITDDANGKTAAEQGVAIGLTYVIIILLFMAVMITGQLIATEITAEKSSRVMEILVTSVAPLKQMFGKIIGTLLAGLLQMAILLAAFLFNLTLPQNKTAIESLGIRLDTIDPMLIVYALFFYLAGYFLYATLFAAIGSIVSRTEDLGQSLTPITLLALAGFYIAIFGLQHPESPVVVTCSFIPFFAPFLMFERIGLGDPAAWEIALCVGILLASIVVFGWLAAKIYRTGVLLYGKRPGLRELVKAMKAFRV